MERAKDLKAMTERQLNRELVKARYYLIGISRGLSLALSSDLTDMAGFQKEIVAASDYVTLVSAELRDKESNGKL